MSNWIGNLEYCDTSVHLYTLQRSHNLNLDDLPTLHLYLWRITVGKLCEKNHNHRHLEKNETTQIEFWNNQLCLFDTIVHCVVGPRQSWPPVSCILSGVFKCIFRAGLLHTAQDLKDLHTEQIQGATAALTWKKCSLSSRFFSKFLTRSTNSESDTSLCAAPTCNNMTSAL